MAIVFPQGFDIASREPIDSRFVLTMDEMRDKIVGEMPEYYFCICKDDGKFYIWDANAEKTSELGRFRSYEEVIDLPAAIEVAIEQHLEELTKSIGPIAVKAMEEKIATQSSPSGLEVKNGDFRVAVDDNGLLGINEDNQLSLQIDLIQAI